MIILRRHKSSVIKAKQNQKAESLGPGHEQKQNKSIISINGYDLSGVFSAEVEDLAIQSHRYLYIYLQNQYWIAV